LADQIAERHGENRVLVAPTDVSDPEQAEALIEQAVDRFGRIDLLANIAGKALLKPLASTEVEEWREMVDANLSSAFYTTKAAWPTFKRQKSGFIVNFSSMASKDPFKGFGVYATVKVGVNMLTMMTAREGKSIGLRAVCIAPGAVETGMLRSMFSTDAVPEEKSLDPMQVAELIRDCVSGKREFDPGQTLFVER
jgi:NAD(P)-dependent dehydrogenase (short-subunit alcohol dehydrogenase family)